MVRIFTPALGSNEPGSATFAMDKGAKREMYRLLADRDNINPAIEDVIGHTNLGVGDGRISRVNPACHPQYTWLYGSEINLKGVGCSPATFDPQDADIDLEVDPLVPQFNLYTL